MNQACKKCEDLLVEALYGELEATDRSWFEAHIETCTSCATTFAEMTGVSKVMTQRVLPEPEPAYWDGYWAQLEARMEAEGLEPIAVEPTPQRKALWRQNAQGMGGRISQVVRKMFMPPQSVPTWAFQTVAAVLLVALGMVLGRLYWTPPTPEVPIANETTQPLLSAQQVALQNSTWEYVERSELLILGLINFDPETDSQAGFRVERNQQISEELIQQASVLKPALDDAKQRRLGELVADLEVILMQIANLETTYDVPEIDMIKSGVDRRGILLKIDVEEMRLMDQGIPLREESKTPSTTTL